MHAQPPCRAPLPIPPFYIRLCVRARTIHDDDDDDDDHHHHHHSTVSVLRTPASRPPSGDRERRMPSVSTLSSTPRRNSGSDRDLPATRRIETRLSPFVARSACATARRLEYQHPGGVS